MKKISSVISIFFFSPLSLFAQQGEWAWMHGNNSINDVPEWGTQGIPSPSNHPAGTYAPHFWQDLQGNFWVYGGYSTQNHEYGAMWKFDPLTLEWTWMSGSNNNFPSAVYGTLGVFDASNTPGYRAFCAVSWTDNNGKFWLYGGDGFNGEKADLWQYDPDILQWAWMAGTTAAGVTPVYGTLQVPAANNTPGSRRESNASWVDADNNLWMFGGEGILGNKSEMWQFDIALNQWAWMNGPTGNNSSPVYGTQGIFDANNTPGSRSPYSKFTGADGTFWLFGGIVWNNGELHNDLWQYDPAINQWAWISGTNQVNGEDSSGAKCDSSSFYVPASRLECRASVSDSCGNFWIFGGSYINFGSYLSLNDLWVYRPSAGDWTYASGDLSFNQAGTYGTQGVFDPANKPGGRIGASMWMDKDGNLWLWGGNATGSLIDLFNDMWKFIPNPTCPVTSCGTARVPSSAFSTSDTILCEKFCIDYFDSSLNNPVAWQWIFEGGNPATSTLQNPANICYDSPGIFDVTLITTGANGISDTLLLTDFITVFTNPFAPVITQSGNLLTASSSATYQWQLNGTDIPGATGQSYEITQSGLYTVIITDENGCTAESSIDANYVGVEDMDQFNKVAIYPNPSNGNFIIELPEGSVTQEFSIRIINSLGQEVFFQQPINYSSGLVEITLNKLQPAIYNLEIKTEKFLVKKKIIITK